MLIAAVSPRVTPSFDIDGKKPPKPPKGPKPPKDPAPTPQPPSAGWQQTGKITDARLAEISGMATSHAREGVRWVHNDSGDTARVFAIDASGAPTQEVRITGAGAIDWEDLAVGPGRYGGSALYIADVGDNKQARPGVQIYRVAEPAAGATSAAAERIELRYPDGHARNVETLLVDPQSGELVLVTKVKGGASEIFRASKAAVDTGTVTLEGAGTIQLGGLATGGAVSLDGTRIAVRTYEQTRVWHRQPGQSIADALLGVAALNVASPGPQSEAITFAPDGRSIFSLSEGVGEAIYCHAV